MTVKQLLQSFTAFTPRILALLKLMFKIMKSCWSGTNFW